MKRFKVIKYDHRFRNIEKVFDNLTDAYLYMDEFEGQVTLQQIDDNGNVIEEWKKWR